MGTRARILLIMTTFATILLPLPVSHSQASAPPSPGAEGKSELRLGVPTWAGYGPLYLALEKKYFDEAAVSVVLLPGCRSGVIFADITDPRRRFAALAGGRLEGIVTTVDTMALYWNPSFRFQAILGLADSNGQDGVVAKDAVKTIADLRGAKVAYNEGSRSHFFLSVLLRDNGMTERDIQGVNMSQDEAGIAFLRRQVDAAATWEPWLTRATEAQAGHVLADTSSRPGLLMDVLLFRGEVLKAHPAAVRAVITGWYRAVDYWKKNPDESDTLMAKASGCWLEDVRTFRKNLEGVRLYDQATNERYFAPDGQIYLTAQRALEIWKDLRKVASPGTPGDLIDPGFVRR